MTSQIDLNALRNHVHQVQREREQSGTSAAEQSRPVTVDREGGVHLGQPGGVEVSQVPIEKFAAAR
jgi:hypothetical protein